MKAFLCLAVLCAIAVAVMGESCSQTSDCHHLTCDAGYSISCPRLTRYCTCSHDAQSCTTKDDCPHCRVGDKHCIDSKCNCPFNIGK